MRGGGGGLTIKGELNSQMGLDSRGLAAMYFCKRAISMATLL